MSRTGEALQKRRLQANKTQEAMARKLNRLRGWVSFVETGRIGISLKELWEWIHFTETKTPTPAYQTIVHQTIRCPKCRQTLYDDPPCSSLYHPCRCGWGS